MERAHALLALGVNEDGPVVGEEPHRAKLTNHHVCLIHELRAESVKRVDIAVKFEISRHTGRDILCHLRRAQSATGQKRPRRA